jgi:nitrogen regulatory protein PII
MKRTFTTLTDATLITAVVQHGFGEVVTDALLEVGIRERLGAVGVAVDAERDIVSVMVSSDEVDRVFERIFLAGKLDTPGMGFMYATPLMQAATYVPPSILAKYSDA